MHSWSLLLFAVWVFDYHFLATSAMQEQCECGVANEEEIDFRIINGRETAPHAYPWSVYLTYNDKMYCGGAIICDRYILTAGHCVYNLQPQKISVYAGAHNMDEDKGTLYEVDKYIIHPEFTRHRDYDDNDIALIRTKEVIEYNDKVNPICLPVKGNYVKSLATIAGWGITEQKKPSKILLSSQVRVMSDETCLNTRVIGPLFKPGENFCAYGYKTDTCQGDSGSSLMTEIRPYKYQSLGVVSWGQGCAPVGIPGVYANVVHYVPWILSETKDSYYCRK